MQFSFYYRTCRNTDGQRLEVPIARYRCRRPKRVRPELHRTFSLLPSCLVPYKQTHIGLMESFLFMWLITGHSINEVLNNISATLSNEWYPAGMYLYRIRTLITESAIKLNQTSSFCNVVYAGSGMISPDSFLQVLKGYKYDAGGTVIPGSDGLGLSWYFHQGSWETESHFLFGTPSQHRLQRRI